ncbi:type II toxin-antitoxin system RelE/ParE family toxin [Blastomonas sp.]|uniref:type II toxin-antitoxin system RelE/ParE family toxin n=1 Tax=Blastomonas sp. TaxID=1909299 RepID=UPI0026282D70|nr:type II toxin-antitoxin system RelE/ParE family toxin [Blastomonas sp.]MDM7956395.1 type II toxin-antitoxin system RelE/ParE family toxin [Blastomonas sp.]
MKALVFSPQAEADIEAIWDCSAANWGLDQADRYTKDIRASCAALASGSKQGRPVDVRPGYSKRQTGSHILYFRDTEAAIIIVRVLHGAQDVERYL